MLICLHIMYLCTLLIYLFVCIFYNLFICLLLFIKSITRSTNICTNYLSYSYIFALIINNKKNYAFTLFIYFYLFCIIHTHLFNYVVQLRYSTAEIFESFPRRLLKCIYICYSIINRDFVILKIFYLHSLMKCTWNAVPCFDVVRGRRGSRISKNRTSECSDQ